MHADYEDWVASYYWAKVTAELALRDLLHRLMTHWAIFHLHFQSCQILPVILKCIILFTLATGRIFFKNPFQGQYYQNFEST